jgi:hypothetical protein
VPDYLAFSLIRCPGCTQTYSYQPGALPEPATVPESPQTAEPTPLFDVQESPTFNLAPVTPTQHVDTTGNLLAALLTEPVRELPLQPQTPTPTTRPASKRTPTPEPTAPSPPAELISEILAGPLGTTPLPYRLRAQPTRRTTPTAQQPSQLLLLIAPHNCQHCRAPITTPINRRAATVQCPHPDCKKTTSVYALQFRCGSCAALLETPQRLAGQQHPCPACAYLTLVPLLELLPTPPWPNDPDFFACTCPSCSGRLIARRDSVGLSAVCSHCHVVIPVPVYGVALGNTREPVVVDPRQNLKTVRRMHCTVCDSLIPVTVRACPICLTPNRPGDYPTG